MISNQIIANCIDEATAISGIGFIIADTKGQTVVRSLPVETPAPATITEFVNGDEESCRIDGQIFIKISDEGETAYVLISDTDGENDLCARLTASQIRNLIIAYRDKIDRNSFFQNILLDNLLLVDIYNRAAKLHIDASKRRCVFVIEPVAAKDDNLIEMVKELFYYEAGDQVTAVDEAHVIVIKALEDGDGEEDLKETANMLVDMAGSEAVSDVRVSYGTIADDIKGISKSYKEAKLALEVSKIFYPFKRTIEYSNLGVGRLIYQLPVNLCELFVKEIFGDNIPEEIDEEILATVNKFFENSLNVSETSRQLFIHRNTLIYRIEKLQKATGLDVRVFDDALTLKIALMVVNYMRYNREKAL